MANNSILSGSVISIKDSLVGTQMRLLAFGALVDRKSHWLKEMASFTDSVLSVHC